MVEKKQFTWQITILYFLFFYFQLKLVKMSTETYGWFRVEFLNDGNGEDLKAKSLFFDIYDLWTVSPSGILLGTNENRVTILKKIIQKKLKAKRHLPFFKVLIRKLRKGDEEFNPVEYLEKDHEFYFEKLQDWKQNFEKDYLSQHPNLREQIRHKKVYIRPSWVKLYR